MVNLWNCNYLFIMGNRLLFSNNCSGNKRKKKISLACPKEKKIEKIKFSVDVHKSSNWEKDNQFLLCIHNESFLRGIKNISIVIAGINKIENGKLELELNRSVILQKKVNIPKMKGFVDFPFLEIAKKENIFIIRVIHQETLNKEIFKHKFDYGEYIINIVLKRNDIDRDSIAIPIHIKYDGWDKISGKVHETFPKTLFPMLLSVHSLK